MLGRAGEGDCLSVDGEGVLLDGAGLTLGLMLGWTNEGLGLRLGRTRDGLGLMTLGLTSEGLGLTVGSGRTVALGPLLVLDFLVGRPGFLVGNVGGPCVSHVTL